MKDEIVIEDAGQPTVKPKLSHKAKLYIVMGVLLTCVALFLLLFSAPLNARQLKAITFVSGYNEGAEVLSILQTTNIYLVKDADNAEYYCSNTGELEADDIITIDEVNYTVIKKMRTLAPSIAINSTTTTIKYNAIILDGLDLVTSSQKLDVSLNIEIEIPTSHLVGVVYLR